MEVKELRVQLDPEEQTPEIRAKKRVLSKVLQGNWKTLFKGTGIEFAGFRSYTFEDDASQIDWRASLRTDETLVREYEEYRTLNVYVMVDVSDTMLFSSGEKLKAEVAAELAYDLCDAISKTDDAVGLSMFTDELKVQLEPKIGAGLMPRMKRELLDKENYGGPSDLREVLKFISGAALEPALVMLISDFIDLKDGWERYLTLIAQQMDLVGIMLRDPRDDAFPSSGGEFVLEDPSERGSLVVDTKLVQEEYEAVVEEEYKRIRAAFSKTNSPLVELTTDQKLYDRLLAFFARLQRVNTGE